MPDNLLRLDGGKELAHANHIDQCSEGNHVRLLVCGQVDVPVSRFHGRVRLRVQNPGGVKLIFSMKTARHPFLGAEFSKSKLTVR